MPATKVSADFERSVLQEGRLRRELTKAEIKAEAYDEMINVAESQFNIKIRKNNTIKNEFLRGVRVNFYQE